jgi:FAD/FMN-containing dehydrogenase
MIRGRYRTDPRALAAYAEGAGIYRLLPTAIARPVDIQDLGELIRWAATTQTSLIPRGAGSGMVGGNVGTGVVVDLNGLAERPLEIDPVKRTARTGTQVSLGELNAAAAPHGLRLPPDPSSGGWATVGGVISTNASGPRTLKYGSVRPWVLGVEMVTAGGDLLSLKRGERTMWSLAPRAKDGTAGEISAVSARKAEFQVRLGSLAVETTAARDLIAARFPKVRKNSTGYALDKYLASGDLLDLVIGAEGTLGIVTAATWRLDPIPAHRAALRLTLSRLEDLGELIPMLIAQGASTAELLDRTFLYMVRESPAARSLGLTGEEEGVVLVEFEGDSRDAVRDLATRTSDFALRAGAKTHLALTAPEMDALIKLRKSASPILAAQPGRRSLQVIEDGCVPAERLGEYVHAVRRAAGERGVEVVIFGHAGDGNVHVNSMADLSRPDWADALRGLYGDVTDAVIRLGGVPSGEHGDGRLRAGTLERVYGPEVVALFRRVKETFDPAGILNPGIKLGPTTDPIQGLKIGPDAAPIPADIAEGLREIEKTGGYAMDRLKLADMT